MALSSPRRALVGALAAAAMATPAVVVISSPAHAASCIIAKYTTTAGDYARTTDVSGGCSSVGARHRYDPVWSSNNYWTSWRYGGDVAQSTATAQLIYGGHSGY